MIRNIVCDMGGVLIEWNPVGIVRRLHLPPEDEALLLREVFQSTEWVAQDRGVVPQPTLLAAMQRRLPVRLHDAAAACYDWWRAPFTPIEGMDALLHELKAQGYALYILSNASRALHDYFPRLPGSDVFDDKFVSADWGLLKPDRSIFQRFCEEFRLVPEECYFIDDFAMNVEAAMRMGMHGTVFYRDIRRLRRELCDAGVTVSL